MIKDGMLEDYHNAFKANKDFKPFDPKIHNKYQSQIPAGLFKEWQEYGFRGYHEGFIWTCDPEDKIIDPLEWKGVEKDGIEILRSAFGDVCIFQNNKFEWLNIYTGKFSSFNANLNIHFNFTLIRESFREEFLLEKLFKVAVEDLGLLAWDECYGFAPLPILGGAMTKNYLIKVKVKEYLSLVAQASS